MAGTAGRRAEGELFPRAVSQGGMFVRIFMTIDFILLYTTIEPIPASNNHIIGFIDCMANTVRSAGN